MKKQPIKDDEKKTIRIFRGDSWYFFSRDPRVSRRVMRGASDRSPTLGFRIVRNKDPKK